MLYNKVNDSKRGGQALRKVASLLVGAIPAAVFALTLGSAAPASAQFIFDVFNPPEPTEPPQYYNYRPVPQRAEEPRYRSHRRHHYHESRRRQRKHRTAREDSWKPKSVKGPFQIVVAIGPQELLLYGQEGLIARAPIGSSVCGWTNANGSANASRESCMIRCCRDSSE